MTSTPLSDPPSVFLEARTRAEQEWSDQQRRAVRMIAGQAQDRTEFAALLSMLDLGDPALRPVMLGRRLAAYVLQVAFAIGVPAEATGYDVSDLATAYVGVDHDLMLRWDERLGWYATPANGPAVVAYLDGDIVPPPATLTRFVADVAAGRCGTRIRPVQPPTDRDVLAAKLAAACPRDS